MNRYSVLPNGRLLGATRAAMLEAASRGGKTTQARGGGRSGGAHVGQTARSVVITDKGRAYLTRLELLRVFGDEPMPAGVPHQLVERGGRP